MENQFNSILQKLTVTGGGVLGIRITGLLVQIALFMLIARILPIESVGIYAVINSFWMIIRHLGSLGLDQASMKYLPLYENQGSIGKAQKFESLSMLIVFVVGLLFSLFVWGLGSAGYLRWITGFEDQWLYISLPLASYSLIGLMVGRLRANGKALWAQLPESLLLPCCIFIGVLIATGLSSRFSLIDVLLIQAGNSWLVLFVYLIVGKERREPQEASLDRSEISEIWKMSFKTLCSQAATSITVLSPVFLVSIFMGNAAAAIFETASRFGRLPSLITWAMGVTLSPLISVEYKKGNMPELQKLLTLGSWIASLASIGVFIVYLVAGKFLLIFAVGEQYSTAYLPMMIIVVSIGINAMYGLVSNLYVMTGHEGTVLRFSLAGLATVLIGIPLVGNIGGTIAAAVVILIAVIVRDGGMAILLGDRLNLRAGLGGRHGARLLWGQLKNITKRA